MSIRRIAILLYRELVRGPKQFIFIFALLLPIVLSLVLSLLFGTFFAGKPRLGISDAGNSQLTQSATAMETFTVRRYADEAALREATQLGVVDIGLVLPADFDQQVATGQPTSMLAYIWGESLLRDRALLVAAMTTWVRDIAGQESPVAFTTSILGGEARLPWEDRLLPLIVLMSVVFGAIMLPAASLVSEKEQRTLTALSVTPVTLGDIYVAKGLTGVLISTVVALIVLGLNNALNSSMFLLLGVVLLGAIFSAEVGVLMGGLVKDINSLFATIKAIGLLLYAPALITMFPEIPQWSARIFPTYYVVQPVIEIVQHGAGLSDIAWQLGILLLLIVGTGITLILLTRYSPRPRTV